MFAVFRSYPDKDLAQIGEEHLQNDLSSEDRSRLRSAASTVSTHTTVGSLLCLGLGIALASRIHANRVALYNAIKHVARPTELIFANGRRGQLHPLLRLFCSMMHADANRARPRPRAVHSPYPLV